MWLRDNWATTKINQSYIPSDLLSDINNIIPNIAFALDLTVIELCIYYNCCGLSLFYMGTKSIGVILHSHWYYIICFGKI